MVGPRLGRGGRGAALPLHSRGHARAIALRQARGGDLMRRALVTGFAALVALLTIAPLLWMLSVSFMAPGEAAQFPPPLLPENPGLDNYRQLFGTYGVGRFHHGSASLRERVCP